MKSFLICVISALASISAHADTDKYRVCWVTDPTTTTTIAWNQKSGEPGWVLYGENVEERKATKIKPQRIQMYDGMKNCFARLSKLKPDTEYFFSVNDKHGSSREMKFRTAPAEAKPFTFVAGGDSRNFHDVRIAANQLSEKLRPLFVAFTGDMINQDTPEEWVKWLDDWQHTISDDGHMLPIVAHRGNHESRKQTITNYFDTPADAYYSFSIGGDLFRYYTLNSQIPATGAQEEWLDADLEKHWKKTTHLVAGYHKPMRPHVSAKSEGTNPMAWADNFYKYGLDLSLESDSHVMKRTLPLKPDEKGDEGFSPAPNDPKATVYIGEGCWGAPLRAADDSKSWTLDADSFNGIDWIRISPEKIEVKTVRVEDVVKVGRVDPAKPFTDPKGLKLWQAKGGSLLEILADR